ncbi:MAG: hypothetical protein FWG40_09130 [Peptococcaceae bacterium]|nr:hypothetical protein [Peptococcaceae bacterium]
MSKKRIRRMIVLNVSIIAANIILFSKMFFGLSLAGGSALAIALGWTVVVVSVCAFIVGNKRLLKREETRSLTRGLNNLNDCVRVLEESRWIKTFAVKINELIDQIKRFRKKQTTINDILLQKFTSDEITYRLFAGVLGEVERAVFTNVRSILNKISAFDEDEYLRITRGQRAIQKNMYSRANREALREQELQRDLPATSQGNLAVQEATSQGNLPVQESRETDMTQEKMQIYNEYISFVNEATEDNEQILLKMDKMLLEISRYNSLEGGDVENMPAIKEMDELIHNAKLYK